MLKRLTAPAVPGTVLFFDGHCVFCHGKINFLVQHNVDAKVSFSTVETPEGQFIVQNSEKLKKYAASCPGGFDSIVLIQRRAEATDSSSSSVDEQFDVTWKSEAAFRIGMMCQTWWVYYLAVICYNIMPRFICNVVYDIVARNRFSTTGVLKTLLGSHARSETCIKPTKELKARMLKLPDDAGGDDSKKKTN
jgi:predicted DCC family thiol-disulfide oxidoreductase YuxK